MEEVCGKESVGTRVFPILTIQTLFLQCVCFFHLHHQTTYDATLLENTATFIFLQCVYVTCVVSTHV